MRVIIAGGGDVGYNTALSLSKEKHDVIIIEQNETRLRIINDSLDVQTFIGSGSSPSVLKEAGIASSHIFIAVTDSDEVNMVACLFVKNLSPNTIRIARIRNPDYTEKHTFLNDSGLDLHVLINPEAVTAEKITNLLEILPATEAIEFAEKKLRLVGIKTTNDSLFAGKKLKELRELKPADKILVAAIARNHEILIPSGQDVIEAGDILYVVSEPDKTEAVMTFFSESPQKVKRVIIYGGSNIGYLTAKELEKKSINIKLIESNKLKCMELAKALNKAVVFHGEGTDRELLEEENIKDCDVFLALSEDEEENILAALLAKKLGAKNVMVVTNKQYYISLVTTIGIDVVISPRQLAASMILQHVRQGRVFSVSSIGEEAAEVIEVEALETSDIVNRPLKEINFPKGAIIGAVVRDDKIIIPSGDDIILHKDRVIIFSLKKAVPLVEKALMVKLEYF